MPQPVLDTMKEVVPPEPFRTNLLGFYDQARRPMPWRETKDPYAILVSETMLQQTQVQTVIPYYLRFMARFPDPASLAAASEADLLKLWEGLGYYRRARNLQAAAKHIVSQFDGVFPTAKSDIDTLPGVGPYTSAAVASIAFNQYHAAVDGNVIRVLSRLYACDDDMSLTVGRQRINTWAQQLIDPKRPGDYNQALMELGATVCTPRNPSCMTCPIQSSCRTVAQGTDPHQRPAKSKKLQPNKALLHSVFLFQPGRIWLGQRPATGLMAGLWELPSLTESTSSWPELLKDQAVFVADLGVIEHRFTHLHASYKVTAYRHLATEPAPGLSSYATLAWIPAEQLDRIPLTRVFQKLWPRLKPYLGENPPCPLSPSSLPGH